MRTSFYAGHIWMASAALLIVCPWSHTALAHGIAGDRFFPATIVVDDPAVADELSFPTASQLRNGDNIRETDVSTEYSKRITEHFGVSLGENWTHFAHGANGFQNLETTFKYQLITDAKSEFILSAGLSVEWGNTGARSVGAEGFNTYAPQIYFGKGLGDLPEDFDLIRPFAITGQVGYAIPGLGKSVNVVVDPITQDVDTETERHPRNLEWGLTLQYSLPYMNSHVKAIEGPGSEFLRQLIPLVEATFTTPVSNFTGPQITTGTINPGVIWAGTQMQVGIEAIIPVNRDSGHGVGCVGQIHFYLDDIFPDSIGKPLLEVEK